MADQRGGGIAWTDATWNPVRGCSRVSEGCRFCYAEAMAARFSGPGQPYHGLATRDPARWTGKVKLVAKHLRDPLRWRKPRRVFVNSMSDLFHEALPDEVIRKVFTVMALAGRHTFQVLTKRPERMAALVPTFAGRNTALDGSGWPVPNVWLGVSVENQAAADERIPLLLQTPAAVRFVSAEPLLGPVDLSGWLGCGSLAIREERGLDWVIVGGESGPHARPCDVARIRDIVRQCQDARVPVFVKQLGSACGYCNDDERRLGEWFQGPRGSAEAAGFIGVRRLKHPKAGDPSEWPADLRVREFPAASADR